MVLIRPGTPGKTKIRSPQPLQIFAGDQHGLQVQATQPVKVAAMEAHWTTGRNVPFIIFAIPDEKAERNREPVDMALVDIDKDGEVDFDERLPVTGIGAGRYDLRTTPIETIRRLRSIRLTLNVLRLISRSGVLRKHPELIGWLRIRRRLP